MGYPRIITWGISWLDQMLCMTLVYSFKTLMLYIVRMEMECKSFNQPTLYTVEFDRVIHLQTCNARNGCGTLNASLHGTLICSRRAQNGPDELR